MDSSSDDGSFNMDILADSAGKYGFINPSVVNEVIFGSDQDPTKPSSFPQRKRSSDVSSLAVMSSDDWGEKDESELPISKNIPTFNAERRMSEAFPNSWGGSKRDRRRLASSCHQSSQRAGVNTNRRSTPLSKVRFRNRRSSISSGSRKSSRVSLVGRKKSVRQRRNSSGSRTVEIRDGNTEDALATFASGGGSSMAAAAAVVAFGANATSSSSRHHIRYNVDDDVFVYLSVLNETNDILEPRVKRFSILERRKTDESTINSILNSAITEVSTNPVNKYGYPRGHGRTIEEQRGPYLYVLAKVKKVHFEEDARYYTVEREDTKKEQRADVEWMEPVPNNRAKDAAQRAAISSRTKKKLKTGHHHNRCSYIYFRSFGRHIAHWFIDNILLHCWRWYSTTRRTAKKQVTLFLDGSTPYLCWLRLTMVNHLVFCSLIFNLLDQGLLFIDFETSARLFTVGKVVMVVVWITLVLELMFEFLIRPSGYNALIKSEKAFAPSTARYIDRIHLCAELLALVVFIPELYCSVNSHDSCGWARNFTLQTASIRKCLGSPHMYDTGVFHAILGHLIFATIRLRIFGLVRHWKIRMIGKTFDHQLAEDRILRRFRLHKFDDSLKSLRKGTKGHDEYSKKSDSSADDLSEAEELTDIKEDALRVQLKAADDMCLNNAANIGTALMVTNSHRVMALLIVVVGLLPILTATQTNNRSRDMVNILNEMNVLAKDDCAFLEDSLSTWLRSFPVHNSSQIYVVKAQVYSDKCDSQCIFEGKIGACDNFSSFKSHIQPNMFRNVTVESNGSYVSVLFNEKDVVANAAFSSFLLQIAIIIQVILGLSVLYDDAGRCVLDPLRKMLKIVLQYASNPLDNSQMGMGTDKNDQNQLGSYETEQLLNAVTKITDLMRKCWGVAGAGIISSNLARTEDGKSVSFNPCVPGKRVYALFGFASICDFTNLLRNLDKDVISLINDVAKVIHGEVYRWAFGDSGQCNKNLGGAFLMVFRIGDTNEVKEKKERATALVFSSKRYDMTTGLAKRRQRRVVRNSSQPSGHRKMIRRQNSESSTSEIENLQLSSLPGITAFTDRALIGMLKTFAGIHRDKRIQEWADDFRLGAGVGAFTIEMIFGMDAGWAVEGAVGSEYKIDATYLSPHVNMASRMMSATKQYGVTILVSQAVQELLSDTAKSKLRHLDTVTVKGSSLRQPIYTYDARHKHVDFFLYERSDDDADFESERYTSNIWNTDQDLRAMNYHISDEFLEHFNIGREEYLAGNWKSAITNLDIANNIMIHTILEAGITGDFVPSENLLNGVILTRRVKAEHEDGTCRCLIDFMTKLGGVAPEGWAGFRPLTSK